MKTRYKPGDRVSFPIHTSNGISFRTRIRFGTIAALHGDRAIIKYRGREYSSPTTDLRKPGEKNALTELIESMFPVGEEIESVSHQTKPEGCRP